MSDAFTVVRFSPEDVPTGSFGPFPSRKQAEDFMELARECERDSGFELAPVVPVKSLTPLKPKPKDAAPSAQAQRILAEAELFRAKAAAYDRGVLDSDGSSSRRIIDLLERIVANTTPVEGK